MTTNYSAWLGKSETMSDTLTQSGIDRFLDTIVSSKSDSPDIAPPGFHWCLGVGIPDMLTIPADGNNYSGEIWPTAAGLRLMWASTEISFLSPLKVADKIERRYEIKSIRKKEGRSGKLVFIQVEEQTSVNGKLAIDEMLTLVYREPEKGVVSLPEENAALPQGWDSIETLIPDEKLLFRYSALTFNTHRIHYDVDYARAQEGYPALVVHGPLSATLLLQEAAKQGTLSTFKFKGISPTYCNQALHLVSKKKEGKILLAAYGADGQVRSEAEATLA